MKLNLRRKSVYVGTILAMVAMISGFALAASLGGLSGTPSGQNAGAIGVSGSSQFASAALSVNLVQATIGSGVCGAAATWASSTNVYVDGTQTCVAGTGWFEAVAWPSFTPAVGTDTFFFTTSGGGGGPLTATFTESTTATAGVLTVYLYVGTAAGGALPDAYTGISIAVNGK